MLFDWIAPRMQVWMYMLILAVVLGLANGTGKAGSESARGFLFRGRRTRGRILLFLVMVTGILILTLGQGFLGAFLDAGLAAKVYFKTGDISTGLFHPSGQIKGIMAVLIVIGMFLLAIFSGGSQLLEGDSDE